MPAKRQCTGCKDGASSAKVMATADGRTKTAAKVLPLPRETEESTSATCQPSSSASTHASHSSSSSSSSSEDENDEDMAPSTTSSSNPVSLLAIVKEKPTMSDVVMKNVESIFRLLNK